MGKRLFHEVYASQDRTDALALPELMVVSEEDDRDTVAFTYHTVHKSYFSKEKPVCPYCRKQHATETKIRPRKFKDILPSENGERNVIDLIFHQRYLSEYEHRQVANTLKRRHRLAAAYNAYQELLQSMETGWDVRRIVGWVDDLPDYLTDYADADEQLEALWEFDIVKTILNLYEPQINAYLALKDKPSAAMASAIMSILDSLEEMPFCIYDVLHARMLLNVEQDRILKDGVMYRIGVPVDRLTRKMYDITEQIKKKKENERDGYEPED